MQAYQKEYDVLRDIESEVIKSTPMAYQRELFTKIAWDNTAISIFGERGIGKTTMLLQSRKKTKNSFYFSADNHTIESIGLFYFVFWSYKNYGITTFYIDEIHKYSNWIQEIKNCIDSLPSVSFRISGSSSFLLYKGTIDLARRITGYQLFPFSFREYLLVQHNISLPSYSFADLAKNPYKTLDGYAKKFTQVQFNTYCKQGMYPYGIGKSWEYFVQKNNAILNKIIMEDMFGMLNTTQKITHSLQKVFYFLATMSPSQISISSLAKKVGTSRVILEKTLFILHNIGVVHMVEKDGNPSEVIRKQRKIFLGNPNLYASHYATENIGTLRESFFLSQLDMAGITPRYITAGDYSFETNGEKFFVEIGGRKKSRKQLKNVKNSFVLSDNFSDIGEGKLPLWAMGFLSS